MAEEEKIELSSEQPATSTAITTPSNKEVLSTQLSKILDEVVAETDVSKTKDLTSLFNDNQKKKSMLRAAKLNDLLDLITDKALERFSEHPDEISNADLLASLKAVQDSLDKHQKQITASQEEPGPLIQINQQTTSVNVDPVQTLTSKESRDRVKNAVLDLLKNLNTDQHQDNIIEVDPVEAAEEINDVK